MKERREVKEKDRMKYRQMHTAIKNEIRHAKDRWFREQCEEIEELDSSFNWVSKWVKQMAGLYKNKQGALFQPCRDVSCDYIKAFDNVKHDTLMSILQFIGLDKNIRIIHHLYYNQTANIRVGKELTEEVNIQRGVRQGCTMSILPIF
ncbi:hypothetical protein HUJ05_003296 [Dendroctonus ponderosae]|nr:hypothetical protein HUJ05_003296 [Dendroctonus ponderosae]